MVRIYVVGGGGSGKTTLAVRLGDRFAAPVVHLDEVFFPPGRAQVMTRDERDAAITRLSRQESWVIDGAYPAWIDEFAAASHLVVWLDVPFRVAAWRIVRRHVLADLRGRNRHPGYRRLWRFLQSKRDYYRRPDQEHRRRLAAEGDTRWGATTHCRAHVATRAAAQAAKLLHITRGRPEDIVRAVAARLSSTADQAGAGAAAESASWSNASARSREP